MFPFDNNSSADQNPPSPPPHLESSLLLKRTPSSSHFQNPNPPPSPLFFSNFPSPFFDEHELPLPQMLAPIDKPQSPAVAGGKSRRRPAGKKDRHSKIRTAHGVRDRRMRLSLQVARKFFDIQDMLGFDKASSTIEWLFTKSKHAIRDLVIASKRKNDELPFDFSDSFSSECEAMSGVAHEMMIVSSEKSDELLGQDSANRAKNKSRRIIRPSDRARESRERARARARWRTREKMMFKKWNERNNIDQDLDRKLGFSIDQEFSGNYSLLLGQDRDAGTIEKLLGNSSLSSASNIISPISDNNNNNNNDSYRSCVDPSGNLMGFVGDWEMLSNVTNQQGNSNDNSVITTHNFPLLFPQ